MSMDKVSFQNGFLAGMATKGLVRSGELYKPIIWNDEGVYTYFYIGFRRTVTLFSTGMWNESIVVHDSVQIKATDVIDMTGGVYKIVCDISNRPHGITVMNKKTSRLRFSSGEQIPPFSVHMYILGQPQYLDAGYFYSKMSLTPIVSETAELFESAIWENIPEVTFPTESASLVGIISSTNETVSIVLT